MSDVSDAATAACTGCERAGGSCPDCARREVVQVLRDANLDREARRVGRCGRDWMIARCGRGHVGDTPVLCGHRLCPDCARTKAARFAESYLPGCLAMRYPVMLTTTVANLPDLAPDDLRRIRNAFSKRLRRRAVLAGHECRRKCRRCPLRKFHRGHSDGGAWCIACRCPGSRAGVVGGLIKTEVTNNGKGWHLHLHVVLDLGHDGPISVWWLGEEWKSCARAEGFRVGDYPIQIERIKAGLRRDDHGKVRYVTRASAIKYALKYASKEDIPDGERWKFARAIKGNRLVQPFGKLRANRDVEGWVVDASRGSPVITPWPNATHKWMLIAVGGKVRRSNRAPLCQCCVEAWAKPMVADEIADEAIRAAIDAWNADQSPQLQAAVEKAARLRDPQQAALALLWAGAPVTEWRSVGLFSTLIDRMETVDPYEFDDALIAHVHAIAQRGARRDAEAIDEKILVSSLPKGGEVFS